MRVWSFFFFCLSCLWSAPLPAFGVAFPSLKWPQSARQMCPFGCPEVVTGLVQVDHLARLWEIHQSNPELCCRYTTMPSHQSITIETQ